MDEVLGDLAVHAIISKLEPNDTARISCLNKKFKAWASEDCFWSQHCSRELSLSSPVDPFGNPAPSFKAAYWLWREAFISYPWTLVKQVKMCWDKLKSLLGGNFPEVLASLRRGATEEELNEVEKSLQVKLPPATRLIYRLHNGQELSDRLLGLIGGYSVYGHKVNVHLLPLRQAVQFTREVTRVFGFSSTSKYVIIAASSVEKIFFLNCADVQIYAGTVNLHAESEMMPCVPTPLLKSCADQQCDGLLLWLEEHGRRLESGMITVREEDGEKFICQFPEKPALCTMAVTNGVQVRASAVLLPEKSNQKIQELMFAYSIRMSLSPEGCTVNGMNFKSCQLYWRHWFIREGETIKHDVDGEGVIGLYPVLLPGDKEFVYQSCTAQQSVPGSIEGYFTFVPGRMVAPEGDLFDVEVARVPLVMPDYIF